MTDACDDATVLHSEQPQRVTPRTSVVAMGAAVEGDGDSVRQRRVGGVVRCSCRLASLVRHSHRSSSRFRMATTRSVNRRGCASSFRSAGCASRHSMATSQVKGESFQEIRMSGAISDEPQRTLVITCQVQPWTTGGAFEFTGGHRPGSPVMAGAAGAS